MPNKGAPAGNSYAKKGRGHTITLYLKSEDMDLLRYVQQVHNLPDDDAACIDLARKAAKRGVNALLVDDRYQEAIQPAWKKNVG
ncbi:MAG: hypothetical protein ABI324_21570 [Ktedonobacteraceae bacterium]